MTTTDQDLRAMTYLARRLRDETHGCAQWDEAGTFTTLKAALAGQNLLIALQRVIGHATDPEARTPGAIKRPFTPEPTTAPVRMAYDPRTTCHDCGQPTHANDDHPFRSVEYVRSIQAAPIPSTIRDAIEPTRTWPSAEHNPGVKSAPRPNVREKS